MGDDARHRAGGPRLLRPRHPASVSEDAGLIRYLMRHRHTHAVRDVRDQVPREAADLRRAAVDPPPHRQRERILRALFDPGPGVLHPRARAPGRAIRPSTGRAAARCWRARRRPDVLALLRDDAERSYDHYAGMLNEEREEAPGRSGPPGPGARTGADEPDAEHLYAMVLEDRPAQSASFPVAARRRPRAIRNPRLCRGDAGDRSTPGCPLAAQAFRDYRLGAVTFSAPMLAVLRRMLAGETVEQAGSGLSAREWREMMASLERAG